MAHITSIHIFLEKISHVTILNLEIELVVGLGGSGEWRMESASISRQQNHAKITKKKDK